MWTKSGSFQIVAKLSCPRQRLQPFCSQCPAGGHDLDTDDDVAVGLHRVFDFFFVDEARIRKDAVARPRYPAQGREIDIIQDPRIGVFCDVIAEYGKETMTRATGIHDSCDTGPYTKNIRINTEGTEPVH